MSLRIMVDQSATQARPAALSEAKAHPTADVAHPYAYCEKYLGRTADNLRAVLPVFHKTACPKEYRMNGFVSAATKNKMMASAHSMLNVQMASFGPYYPSHDFQKGFAFITAAGLFGILLLPETLLTTGTVLIIGGIVMAGIVLFNYTKETTHDAGGDCN